MLPVSLIDTVQGRRVEPIKYILRTRGFGRCDWLGVGLISPTYRHLHHIRISMN